MRLATIARKSAPATTNDRDGLLVVVGPDETALAHPDWPTLRFALENWSSAEKDLRSLSDMLSTGKVSTSTALTNEQILAPLPRTFAWLDGSAFVQHVILVRKARGAEPPDDLFTVPLMYQGVSDNLLGPEEPIPLGDPGWGLDLEGEVYVILDDVPLGITVQEAGKHIKLVSIMNDITLRNLIPRELAAGFGFFHGKPASSFAPFVVTPDELGGSWREGRVHLDLECFLNGVRIGHPNAGEMHFSFPQLIEHAAKTRSLPAGTILGSGTVSNKDEARGVSCLAERRMLEKIATGDSKTPFLKSGDVIEITMKREGVALFGSIRQRVR